METARMRILGRRIESISKNAKIQLDKAIELQDWDEVKRIYFHLEAIKHLSEEIID